MKKIVGLKLEGDLSICGYQVTLEMGAEGQPRQTELGGTLPNFPELSTSLKQWQSTYRQLGLISRIEPGRIVYDGLISDRLDNCRQSAIALTQQLQIWLGSPSFQELDRRLREELHREDEIRFLIRTDIPELQKLPWHLWDVIERYPKAEIALSKLRFEPCIQGEKEGKTRVKILAILGHSTGIDVDRDRQLLEALPQAEITFLVEPQRNEISDRLWNQAWDIIFFAGHSETEGETGRIYINPQDSLTINELWYSLRKSVEQGLQLAIFNSCDGLGLARRLDDLHIPQMIIMRELVPDLIAQEFLKSFLSSFSRGNSFYLSVREARERLQGWEDRFPCATWLPAIYQHPTAIPPTWRQLYGNSDRLFNPITPPATNIPRWGLRTKGAIALSLLLYIILNPYLYTQVNQLVKSKYQQGKHAPAKWLNHLAMAISPWHPASYYNNAYFCREDRQPDETCLKWYERSAALGYADAKAEAAFLRVRLGDYSIAQRWISDCLDNPEFDGVEASCWKNKGWLQMKQGFLDEAKEALEQAIATEEDSPHAVCLLAEIGEIEGNLERSLDYWHQAKNLYDRKNYRSRSLEDQECLRNAKSKTKDSQRSVDL